MTVLRIEIFNLINEHKKSKKTTKEASRSIYDYLDNEGLGLSDNDFIDDPEDLSDIISFQDGKAMHSAVEILCCLEDEGLSLNGNGWFDNDPEWGIHLCEFEIQQIT